MADDRLNKTYEEFLVNLEKLQWHLLKPPNPASLHQAMLPAPGTPEGSDFREFDIVVLFDQGTAKFGAGLLAELRRLHLKVNDVDLMSTPSKKGQPSVIDKLRRGGQTVVVIVGLKLITDYWAQVKPFIMEFIHYNPRAVLPVYYNVAKETAFVHAAELKAVPDWAGSNEDNVERLSAILLDTVKVVLEGCSQTFRSFQQQLSPSGMQKLVLDFWKKYQSPPTRQILLGSLEKAFASKSPHRTKIIILNGPSGFGKTLVAEDFVSKCRSSYDYVIPLKGSNRTDWNISIVKICSLFGICPKRLCRNEMEPIIIKELCKFRERGHILFVCDDLKDVCQTRLSHLIEAIDRPTVHVIVTTQLSKEHFRSWDHYSIQVSKLNSDEMGVMFKTGSTSQLSASAGSRPFPSFQSSGQLDVLDGHPAASGLATCYLAKTDSGLWALKPQYHGIWAELYFTYGKDKFTQWLEKNDLMELRDVLSTYNITSPEELVKADRTFILEIVAPVYRSPFEAGLDALSVQLDEERLHVMVHLNLSTTSRTATTLLNMLSVLSDDWLEIEVLIQGWMKQYKDQTGETAKRGLKTLEKLGLVHLHYFNEDIRSVRVPRCFQKAVLDRLLKDKQTTYKKIVQCLAYVLTRRLTVDKVWNFESNDLALFTHAVSVARHCKRSSLFTISARNIIAFARELFYVYSMTPEAKEFSEHLLKMEQLVHDNHFSVSRENFRVRLAEVDIFSEPLTGTKVADILRTISKSLTAHKLYRIAIPYLERELAIARELPDYELSSVRLALTDAYLASGKEREADDVFKSLSSTGSLVADDRLKKKIYLGRADGLEKAGNYAQAKASLMEVLQLVAPDSEEHVQVLLKLGDVCTKAEYHLDAFGFYKRLLAKDDAGDDVKLRAQNGTALSLKNQGDLQESLNSYQALHSLSRELDNSEYQVAALSGQGDVYTVAHMLDHAIQPYQQALEVCQRKIPKHPDQAAIMNKIGNCHRGRGHLVAAKEAYENCVSFSSHREDKRTEASALCNIGNIYQQMNNMQKAVRFHEKHLEIARQINDDGMIGWASGNIGNSYSSMRKYEEALKYLRIAVDKAEIGNDEAELGRAYSNLGNAYQLSKKYADAEHCFQQSLKIALKTNDVIGEARARGNLGNALQSQNRYKDAVELYERTIELSSMSRVGDKVSEGNAYHNKGCALEGLDDLEKAQESFVSAITIFDELYKQTGSSESFKSTYRQLNSKSFRRLQFIFGRQGKGKEALEISERSRGRQFVDVVERRLVDKSRQLVKSYEQIGYEEIMKLIKGQSAWVLIYSVCRSALHSWVVSPDGELIGFKHAVVSEAGSSETKLDRTIREAVADITKYENLNRLPESDEDQLPSKYPKLDSLSKLLIAPIEEYLPKRSADVVIIPAGLITLVPFAALPCSDGLMMSQKYRIRSVPAVVEFEPQRNEGGDLFLTNSLIVGNPDVPSMLIPGQSEPWKPVVLPNAGREANDLARLVNGHALVGREATKKRVMREMADAQLIHLATHGGQNGTSLFLAPEPSERAVLLPAQLIDSQLCLLTCDEIENMSLKAKLVCLSSCGSARGEPNNDGVMGLARGFLIAGARTVLVTLWRVPDRATEYLMRFFYRNMQRGALAAFALQQAMHQLRCLEQFRHPVHWAGFQIIGPDVSLEFPSRFVVPCVPECQFFVGRENELNSLSEWVVTRESRLKVQYIFGFPGVGKSTLAAEFVRMFNAHYSHIFWVRGHSLLALLDGFCAIASLSPVNRKEKDIIGTAHDYLRGINNWLLVIDGMYDGFEEESYLPGATVAGSVLVIADRKIDHQKGLPKHLVSETSLYLLEQDEAIASLLRRTSTTVKAMTLSDDDRSALKRLTFQPTMLSLPINMEFAGSFMKKAHIPFRQFEQIIEKKFPPQPEKHSRQAYSKPLADQSIVRSRSSTPSDVYPTHFPSRSSTSLSADEQGTNLSRLSFILSQVLMSLSGGACKLLGCFVASGSSTVPIELLRRMVKVRAERSLEKGVSLEEDEDCLTEQSFAPFFAEVLSTSLIKKHSSSVFVTHEGKQGSSSEVLTMHPVVVECLQGRMAEVGPERVQSTESGQEMIPVDEIMIAAWSSVLKTSFELEEAQRNQWITLAVDFCVFALKIHLVNVASIEVGELMDTLKKCLPPYPPYFTYFLQMTNFLGSVPGRK